MKVRCDVDGGSLERFRPKDPVHWKHVADIHWRESLYHSGDVTYMIALIGPGRWALDRVERNACLDDVTEEDVETGRLTDEQVQAMWGTSLEEAQGREHRTIVAVFEGGDEASAKAAMMNALRLA